MNLRHSIRHVLMAPADDGGSAGAAPDGRPAPLNLGQAAEQIGGLNLFGETKAPKGKDRKGKQNPASDDATPEGDDDSGDAGDDPIGKRSHGKPSGADGADDDTDDGSPDDDAGQAEDDDDGQQSDASDEDGDEESEQDADTDDGQEPEIKTVADLAAALEVDEDFLASLQDTFRADGEDVTVTLAELRAGYQRDANYRRQTQELADTRRAIEAEHVQRQQQYEGQLVQLGQVLQRGEQLLIGEVNTAEMQQLRQKNPAEWAARREELQQRINGVRQLYAYAAQEFDRFNNERQQKVQAALKELRVKEMDNLRIALPSWDDKARDTLLNYLDKTYGYQSDELNNVFDSRLIVIANKARLYDEMQEVGKKTRKKVVKLPKVQKPSKGKKPAGSSQTANIRKASQQLRKTGKVKDAANLIGLAIKDL